MFFLMGSFQRGFKSNGTMHLKLFFILGLFPSPVVFKPSDDSKYSQDPFFKDDPIKLLEQGKVHNVPVMIGVTKDEGLIYSAALGQRSEFMSFLRY